MAVKKMKKSVTRSKIKKTKYSKTTIIVLGILLLAGAALLLQIRSAQHLESNAATTNCEVTQSNLDMDSEEQNFVNALNQYRSSKGIGGVRVSPNLIRAAAWMSNDLAKSGNLVHTDSLGRDPATRIANCGYSAGFFGENISADDTTGQQALITWQADDEHDTILSDPRWLVIGIARVQAANGKWYWTMDAGDTDDTGGAIISAAPNTPNGPNVPVSTVPSSVVPSPNCLGPCVTLSPSPSQSPDQIISPIISDDPNQPGLSPAPSLEVPSVGPITLPSTGTPGGTTPGGGDNGGGNNQTFLGFILSLLALLLQFFMGLFGGK